MVLDDFSTQTVARVTGVTPRQLDYWADTRFIVPTVQVGAGRGRVRRYGFADLVQVKVAKRLGDAGISLQKMRKAVATLRSLAPAIDSPLAHFQLISDGQEIYVAHSKQQLLAISKTIGQFYWWLKVEDLVSELKQTISQLTQTEETTVAVAGKDYSTIIYRDLDSDWWIGECPGLKGCVTQGKTRREAASMLHDAVSEYLAASSRKPARDLG